MNEKLILTFILAYFRHKVCSLDNPHPLKTNWFMKMSPQLAQKSDVKARGVIGERRLLKLASPHLYKCII